MAGKFLDRFSSFLEGLNSGLQTANNRNNPVTIGNNNLTNEGNNDNSKWLIVAFIVGGFFLISKMFK